MQRFRGIAALIVGAASLNCVTPARAEIRYAITDLGTLGGTFSEATGINNDGDIVGISDSSSRNYIFKYSGGTMLNIAPSTGTTAAINNADTVVGTGSNFQGGSIASFYTLGGGEGVIFPLQGGASNAATSINDAGAIVGWSDTDGTGSANRHAFYFGKSGLVDLGTLGGKTSIANDVNNFGFVVGQSQTAEGAYHAVAYNVDYGLKFDLGTLGGGISTASALTDSNFAAGVSYLTNNAGYHAFLYAAGLMADLGALGVTGDSAANDLNDSQVVGYSTAGNDYHAFVSNYQVYNSQGLLDRVIGPMVDLNTLIDPSLGWNLRTANGINENGQIIGGGFIGDDYHAFLLNPIVVSPSDVPESSTWAMFILGFGLTGYSIRNNKRKVLFSSYNPKGRKMRSDGAGGILH